MLYSIQIPVFPLYDYRCKIKRLLHLCTFKPPTKWAVMSERGDANCAFQMRNGVKKIEEMDLFISINVLKILIYLQDIIDIFLKEIIILFLQKLIKSLCKTVKILTLRDKCSSCDE